MEGQDWAAGEHKARESAGTRASGLGPHRSGRGSHGGGSRGGGGGCGACRPPRCRSRALAPAGGAAAAHLFLPGHAGPRPPGSGVPLAAALHQLRPALAPDSPGLAQLRLHAARHRPDGQCISERTSEGVSELEIGALPRRDSAKVEMQLEGDSLYISQANFILAYQFRPDGASLNRRPLGVFAGHDEDVCHFVLANSHIVSAGGDGKIGVHKIHSTFTVKYSAHEQEVNCVDCKGGIIVSGSRDRTAKVWPLASGRLGQCLHTIHTEDRVWSIAISPLLSSFVTGTACCGHFSPLRIWDLNSGQLMTHLGSDFPPGAGVLDVMYESPSTLLSCGYDTYVRYWDLRASVRKCVMEWEEPHDSTLYCLQTDGNHLLATGSSYYGVVRLWDRRQRACLHAFPLTSTPLSSPVYCLRFTTKHLYAALSYNLHVLDFQNP
uniref:F-box and WD repeat domain containing 4 n=1 Tax=Rousettus aegyptiacus TaxID=9407 RepID=A0A7J8G889_ROUAE|nr:F-box and WD repeat domain containing 4 [Rousettus aegyptiacus]